MPGDLSEPHASSPSWIARSSLTESGITRDAESATDRVAKIGDPVVAGGALEFYTAGRYRRALDQRGLAQAGAARSCRGDRHRRGTAPGGCEGHDARRDGRVERERAGEGVRALATAHPAQSQPDALTHSTLPGYPCDSAKSATFPTTRVRFPALGHARYAGRSRSAVNPCRRTKSSSLLAFTAAHAPYDKQPPHCDDCEPPRS
jgi:hypothetical protein